MQPCPTRGLTNYLMFYSIQNIIWLTCNNDIVRVRKSSYCCFGADGVELGIWVGLLYGDLVSQSNEILEANLTVCGVFSVDIKNANRALYL